MATRPRTWGRHIERTEDSGHHGWAVRLHRRGTCHRRWFPDGDDPQQALLEAMKYRDRMLLKLEPASRVGKPDPRNKTGVIGVRLIDDTNGQGVHYVAYEAEWPVSNGARYRNGRIKKVRRAFSVLKYGEEGAFDMAVEARRRGVAHFLATKKRQVVRAVARRGLVESPE